MLQADSSMQEQEQEQERERFEFRFAYFMYVFSNLSLINQRHYKGEVTEREISSRMMQAFSGINIDDYINEALERGLIERAYHKFGVYRKVVVIKKR